MNRRQKLVVENFIFVVVITAAAVVGMFNFKDWVNRSESMRAMGQLGQIILSYRQKEGAVPGTEYVEQAKRAVEGGARLGNLHYRGRWIHFGTSGDEILAYSPKSYGHSLLSAGYAVLRLDGRVEWMKKKEFEQLLASQQSPEEKRLGEQQF